MALTNIKKDSEGVYRIKTHPKGHLIVIDCEGKELTHLSESLKIESVGPKIYRATISLLCVTDEFFEPEP